MRILFYILLGLMFFSCARKDKNDKTVGNKVVQHVVPFDEIQRDVRIKRINWEEGMMDSVIMHDSIYKVFVADDCDSQYMYMVCKPKMNLKKMLKYGKVKRLKDFNEPNNIDYWTDPKILQIYFSDRLSSFGFQSHDSHYLLGLKSYPDCDYLFYQRAGPCVGWDFCCLSMDKRGNIIDNIWLTWDWGHDGNYQTAILEKMDDTTFVQVSQTGDNYSHPKKGKFWQNSLTKTQIIFHTNGIIESQFLQSDTAAKAAKKIGEPL